MNTTFTLQQIDEAHSKVKSGADFPAYISEIKSFGVISFETYVSDGHTVYRGINNFSIESAGIYEQKNINEHCNSDAFVLYLKNHQQGKTDFFQFCEDCAVTGIEKWVVDLNALTCIYFNKSRDKVLTEQIPAGE